MGAIHTPKDFLPATRSYRVNFDLNKGGHAVDIVGVDLDAQGRVIKYKIKNSHGTDNGEDGYYHLYRDYFENFLKFVYITND